MKWLEMEQTKLIKMQKNSIVNYILTIFIKDFKDEDYRNDEYVYNQGKKISNIIFNEFIRKGKIQWKNSQNKRLTDREMMDFAIEIGFGWEYMSYKFAYALLEK